MKTIESNQVNELIINKSRFITYLYRIENEKVCPTIIVVANIAEALGVTINDLLPI